MERFSAKNVGVTPLFWVSDYLSCQVVIGESGTRIACFGIESDQKLTDERNANDRFFLSGSDQFDAEAGETFVMPRNGSRDDGEDGADAGAAAANAALAIVLSTVIGDWSKVGKLGNGFVGQGADLRQVGVQPGDVTAGNALHLAPGPRRALPTVGSSSIIEAIPRARGWRFKRAITSVRLASISGLSSKPARRCFWTVRSRVTCLRRYWAWLGSGVGAMVLAWAKRAMTEESVRSVFSRIPIASA